MQDKVRWPFCAGFLARYKYQQFEKIAARNDNKLWTTSAIRCAVPAIS